MPNLFDPISESAKILYIGDSGDGKTGSKAALIAAGYKLRMVDTDRGFKILRSLLTDEEHYPYASFIKKKGIDLTEPGRISYIPIDVPMDFQDVSIMRKGGRSVNYSILSPTSGSAWSTAVALVKEWKDGDLNLGSPLSWEPDVVLDFDTISTLAECAKYWMQDMNNHLGALEDDHGRDSGGAQELIRRLMTKVTSPAIKCNVIFTTHINWVDVGRGGAQSPSQLLHDQKPIIDMRGFPAAIGQALSPQMGKKWNDLFVARQDRSGVQRIYGCSVEAIRAKHSVFVEDSYPLQTGLAEIFAAMRYQPPPYDLIEHVQKFNAKRGVTVGTTQSSGASFGSTGGFGTR